MFQEIHNLGRVTNESLAIRFHKIMTLNHMNAQVQTFEKTNALYRTRKVITYLIKRFPFDKQQAIITSSVYLLLLVTNDIQIRVELLCVSQPFQAACDKECLCHYLFTINRGLAVYYKHICEISIHLEACAEQTFEISVSHTDFKKPVIKLTYL